MPGAFEKTFSQTRSTIMDCQVLGSRGLHNRQQLVDRRASRPARCGMRCVTDARPSAAGRYRVWQSRIGHGTSDDGRMGRLARMADLGVTRSGPGRMAARGSQKLVRAVRASAASVPSGSPTVINAGEMTRAGSEGDTGQAPAQTSSEERQRAMRTDETLERAKGFEPSTPTLARLCSTTELHPHPCRVATRRCMPQADGADKGGVGVFLAAPLRSRDALSCRCWP